MNLAEYVAAERGRAAQIAKAICRSSAFVSQLALGGRPVPAALAATIEQASGGEVRRWDLFPDTWHRIWPELVGTAGAPAVPTEAGRHAA